MSSPAVPRTPLWFAIIGQDTEQGCPLDDAPSQIDDETLMSQVQHGNRDALGTLFDRYSRLVFGVTARILRDVEEAQELVQDIFVQLFCKKGYGFDSAKSSFRSWLIHVAYCRAFDRRDYLNARRFYNSCDISEFADSIPSQYCLDSQAQASELRRLLELAMSQLNPRQRRTLELFFFEGHSLAEISSQLGEPIGNVRHHYYRGLNRLRQALKVSPSSVPNRSRI